MRRLRRIDLERLTQIIDFMGIELSDIGKYQDINFQIYQDDREKRRSVERWIENIVNASLDIARIILISQDLPIPDTYREYFLSISATKIITEKMAEKLAEGIKLRNILAHQYLDIKWKNIKRFLSEDWRIYKQWLEISKNFLKNQITEENKES